MSFWRKKMLAQNDYPLFLLNIVVSSKRSCTAWMFPVRNDSRQKDWGLPWAEISFKKFGDDNQACARVNRYYGLIIRCVCLLIKWQLKFIWICAYSIKKRAPAENMTKTSLKWPISVEFGDRLDHMAFAKKPVFIITFGTKKICRISPNSYKLGECPHPSLAILATIFPTSWYAIIKN